MVFSSSIFILYFLPIFLLVYSLSSRGLKNIIALLASILFYSWGAPKFVFVILVSTIIDFFIVRKLYESKERRKRRLLLSISIFINLGLLAYFKYANFFVDNVNNFLLTLGMGEMSWSKVLLPIGISFYTFQTLTYSIDVYRGIHKPLDKVTDYLLYIMSFPQMIAGPIVRFNTIANQITNRTETIDDKLIGLYRFSIGLAKKVLIANTMAVQADLFFDGNISDLTSGQAWIGMIAYTFQIYFDFSGYSDMAIGLGRMIGFRFPENFNSPYISTSITEFWRRWHMTLGGFMKDYLYIPLGGSKVSTKRRLYFNLGLVFLLSGLWHGASWNFVLWGAFHGTFLILDRMFLLKLLSKVGKILSIIFTFFVSMIGWVIFRLENMTDIGVYLKKIFSLDVFSSVLETDTPKSFDFFLVFAVFFAFLTSMKFGRKLQNYFFERNWYNVTNHIALTLMSLILLILSISFITSSSFNPFIYFRF